MAVTNTKAAEPKALSSPVTASAEKPKLPEKLGGPTMGMVVQRAATGAVPPSGGAPQRARVMRALQGGVGNARSVAVLSRQATAPSSERVQPDQHTAVQRSCSCGGEVGVDGECMTCRATREALQRHAAGPTEQDAVPTSVSRALRSDGGHPIDRATRTSMESAFGADFGDVRLHTDSQAATAARDISAKAFTSGQSIYFGAGQHRPDTAEGQKLLAHELTHTIQQGSGRGELQTSPRISQPGDPLEREAEVVSEQVHDSLTSLRFQTLRNGDPTCEHSWSPRVLPRSGLSQLVMRDTAKQSPLSVPKRLFAPFTSTPDQLKFSNRTFPRYAQPTVCPRCHDQTPIRSQLPSFVDRDATEPRLVDWGMESDRLLHSDATIRTLQLSPDAIDSVVEDYGVGLIIRILHTHEFEGSDFSRTTGVDTIRARWDDIRASVRERLTKWYRQQHLEAVILTPEWASLVDNPAELRDIQATHHNGRAYLGRVGAVAIPGQRYGVFDIDDIGAGQVWFHRPGRPLWYYRISQRDFVRHDPLIAGVVEQVADQTRWILQALPMMMKFGAFAMGFSGSIAIVIAGIVMDELATEMQADAEGKPGRSVDDILGSGATQLIIDRIFHGLFGGSPRRATAGLGKPAARIDRIADKAVPAIRSKLVQTEAPLVKQALERGTARNVTDRALMTEGHLVEVAIETFGERHLYRLNRKGLWCRFTSPICDLDLGADVAARARLPMSFTKANLEEVRTLIRDIEGDISFLGTIYQKMRAIGKFDIGVLTKEERAWLDGLAPSGDAARLSLSELRDLPRTLRLKTEVANATAREAQLVQQLYREGRPLYEIMRAASPSSSARSRVLASANLRDAVTGTAPRSGRLHVDHVIPLNEIVRMHGFDRLRPDRQLEIVNDLKNLHATDSLSNASRGDWSWSDWPQALVYYDSTQIEKMRVLEDSLRTYIEGRIRNLLRP